MNRPNHITSQPHSAFTLVELMVSTALIALLMLLLLGTVDQTQNVWKRTTAKIAQFQASRAAFEAMNRRISQATLNTYYRATDTSSANAKADFLFRRQSELQFLTGHLSDASTKSGKVPGIFTSNPAISGLTKPVERAYPTHGVFFFAPLGITEEPGLGDFKTTRRFRGLDAMLTACGYFIEYGDDPWRPKILPLATATSAGVPPRNRFRLMELSVPAEELTVYKRLDSVGGSANDPTSDPAKPVPWKFSVTPQILNRANGHYIGRVSGLSNNLKSNSSWIRPLWMEEGLKRTTLNATTAINRFQYARVMADNVIALIVLPKLAEKDRGNKPTEIGTLAPEYQFDTWRIIAQDAGAAGVANSVRDNLLPPIVQIVMVAIDETSALRLPSGEIPAWTIGDRQLFTAVKDEADLLRDLGDLEIRLQVARVNYRVFSTDVVIRASKWSKDPKN
jgi:prepilin-type N-terminal cleavage/methylation domain-containing protein